MWGSVAVLFIYKTATLTQINLTNLKHFNNVTDGLGWKYFSDI